MKDYPVGKAQQMVLDALGMTATSFSDADRKFKELGITVSSKRQGRTSIPVVSLNSGRWSRNDYGDYGGTDITASASVKEKLAQWLVK